MAYHKHVSHLLSRMRLRGWDESSLRRAQSILSKPSAPIFVEERIQQVLHWTVFLIIVVANFFASAILVPLLVVFPNPGLYAVVMIMGMCFGLLYAVVLSDITHLFSIFHHFTATLVIPTLAIFNVFFIVSYVDVEYSNVFGEVRHPLVMGLFYALAFMVPYLFLLCVRYVHDRQTDQRTVL